MREDLMFTDQKEIQEQLQEYLKALFRELDNEKRELERLEAKVVLVGKLIQNKSSLPPQTFEPQDTDFSQFIDSDFERLIQGYPASFKSILKTYSSKQEYRNNNYYIYIIVKINKYEEFNDSIEKLIEEVIGRFTRIAQFIISQPEYKSYKESIFSAFPIQETLQCMVGDFMIRQIMKFQGKIDYLNPFYDFNTISVLRYEGESCFGKILLAAKPLIHNNINVIIKFEKPIEINECESKKIRKLLNISDKNSFLIADPNHIYGVGTLDNSNALVKESLFVVNFKGYFEWEFGYVEESISQDFQINRIMVVKNGKPSLPKSRVSQEEFENRCNQIYKSIQSDSISFLWKILNRAIEQKHGTMLVILDEDGAKEEAKRLGNQCFKISPEILDIELIESLTSIDGAILLSANCQCHALGVILDGVADENSGDSARGARYNSAVRYHNYIKKNKPSYQLLMVVISEDGMVNFIPDKINK